MNVLKVLDIINTPNAILNSFGIQVFDAMSKYLSNNQSVTLSFDGLKNITSAFCNASIGKAYLTYPNAANLLILQNYDTNSIWKEKIENAINLASNPEKIKLQNQAISDLLTS